MYGWQRQAGICRASHQLLAAGEETGCWIMAAQHPTAVRPYAVHMKDGHVVERKFAHLIDAQEVLITLYEGAEIGADGMPQNVIPGIGRRDVGAMLQRQADAPLKPRAAQKPADVGLFGDGHLQTDLFGGK
jgi:hypothetical protein